MKVKLKESKTNVTPRGARKRGGGSVFEPHSKLVYDSPRIHTQKLGAKEIENGG